MNLREMIGKAGREFGGRSAVVTPAGPLTYADMLDRASRLANFMSRNGVSPGDRVAILARNSFRYMEVNFACAILGAVLVPLNFRLSDAEVLALFERAECRMVFCAKPFLSNQAGTATWGDEDAPGDACPYEAAILGSAPDGTAPPRASDDLAQIFFTSGTTGMPKGVCLTHGNLVASGLDAAEILDFSPDDVWLHAAPMFHLVDAFAIWGVTFAGGGHVAVHFEPEKFGATVERHGITKTSLPPTLLDWICRKKPSHDHDLSSLRLISYGGSPMQDVVYERCRLELGCQLLQAYGLTEGSGFVCHERPGDNPRPEQVINTVGRPTSRVEVAISRAGGVGGAPGQAGELVIRGQRVFTGYWRDETATRAAFSDGWFHTGDLATVDAAGCFQIVGRKKEMIITGGENVYPAEVVNALLAHPGIVEAAVFGLPSERWGEEVHAVVHVFPGTHIDEHGLISHCKRRLGSYKAPKQITFWIDPLPKTGAGKIATATLRDAILQRN